MVSGVHGVESEAALCPGRGISGPGGRAVEPAEGTRATRASSSGVPITNEGSQSLSEDPLGHSCERYQARAVPAPQPTSLPVDQPSSSHEADSDRLLAPRQPDRAPAQAGRVLRHQGGTDSTGCQTVLLSVPRSARARQGARRSWRCCQGRSSLRAPLTEGIHRVPHCVGLLEVPIRSFQQNRELSLTSVLGDCSPALSGRTVNQA